MRVIATVVLVTYEERALVLRRRPDDRSFAHAWCLPGGGVDPGENTDRAALRETFEESGLAVQLKHNLGLVETTLASRGYVFEIHRFVATSQSLDVRLSDEHVAFEWLSRSQAAGAHGALAGGLAGEVTRELLERFSAGEWP